MTENTDTTGQQPNPGQTTGDAAGAATPNGQPGTDPTASPGQGDGGNDAGDAGKTGDAAGTDKDKAGDGQPDPAKDAAAGPPETYEPFAMPEGFTLEGERLESAQTLFRELGLPQDRAQKLIDHFVQTVGADEAARAQAMEAAVAQQREEWGKQAKAELGANYDAEVAFARTAVQATQNPKLVQAFDELGWGNHPELIKTFAFFGKMMRDSPVDGIGSGGAAATPKKPWDVVYPDMNK